MTLNKDSFCHDYKNSSNNTSEIRNCFNTDNNNQHNNHHNNHNNNQHNNHHNNHNNNHHNNHNNNHHNNHNNNHHNNTNSNNTNNSKNKHSTNRNCFNTDNNNQHNNTNTHNNHNSNNTQNSNNKNYANYNCKIIQLFVNNQQQQINIQRMLLNGHNGELLDLFDGTTTQVIQQPPKTQITRKRKLNQISQYNSDDVQFQSHPDVAKKRKMSDTSHAYVETNDPPQLTAIERVTKLFSANNNQTNYFEEMKIENLDSLNKECESLMVIENKIIALRKDHYDKWMKYLLLNNNDNNINNQSESN